MSRLVSSKNCLAPSMRSRLTYSGTLNLVCFLNRWLMVDTLQLQWLAMSPAVIFPV